MLLGTFIAARYQHPPSGSPCIVIIRIVKTHDAKIVDASFLAVTFAAVRNDKGRNASVITANFMCANKLVQMSVQAEACRRQVEGQACAVL
jgi:hypothetical protein